MKEPQVYNAIQQMVGSDRVGMDSFMLARQRLSNGTLQILLTYQGTPMIERLPADIAYFEWIASEYIEFAQHSWQTSIKHNFVCADWTIHLGIYGWMTKSLAS